MEKNERVLLEWQTHLALSQPKKTYAVITAVLAASFTVLVCFRDPLLAAVCMFLLVSAVAEFLFPIRYRLTETGAYVRNLFSSRYLPWERVSRCYRGPQGIKLSPLSHPGWREAFRGVHLRVEGEEQEKVVEIIRALRASVSEASNQLEAKYSEEPQT
ncbi:MAG: hypothetical protein GTO55_01415 [Armatimonadetes bacterium]|nr:hypothetical protein [Armatimonadota bacterium]NIM22936.1 hypothetical protein [Armatimonadota bacterium]NIM66807.1 hypothetical protein [Armatimonadota bacterium]NIM75348.1 hypothetical protein [Armatimonadota bacterium]NIN04995.1 hypothetical protein [Armatimonadota bacterium]